MLKEFHEGLKALLINVKLFGGNLFMCRLISKLKMVIENDICQLISAALSEPQSYDLVY